MMKNIGNFILGVIGIGIAGIALVMGVTLFVFAFSVLIAILPYLILGFLVAWAIKAITV